MNRASTSDSHCIRLIQRAKPQNILVVSFDEVSAAFLDAIHAPRIVRLAASDYLAAPSPPSPYDLGVAWRATPPQDEDDSSNELRILARMRSVDCRRLCAVMPVARRRALETLGLRYIGLETNHSDLACFEFDIADYKRVPDWLNSEHWANPQQWNKSRW